MKQRLAGGDDLLQQRQQVGDRRDLALVQQDVGVIVLLSAFIRTFGSKRGLVVAVVAPEGKVKETEDEVTAVMRNARHLAPDQEENFSVNRQDKLLEGFNQMMMATNVTGILVGDHHRHRGGYRDHEHPAGLGEGADAEIGIRRAIGARRGTILGQFLCEAVMVAVVGGVVGIALASGAASLISTWISAVAGEGGSPA